MACNGNNLARGRRCYVATPHELDKQPTAASRRANRGPTLLNKVSGLTETDELRYTGEGGPMDGVSGWTDGLGWDGGWSGGASKWQQVQERD